MTLVNKTEFSDLKAVEKMINDRVVSLNIGLRQKN